ncbi:MAG: prepilin peptidase [Parcubacteria group bacterium]|nr:prepilin peptidase [Parcubacteria group bacterium]
MEVIFFTAVFFLGLAAGSFINVLVYRLERGMDVVRLRSHCVNCKHTLNAVDLVPFFGYFIRRGRCAYCGVPISPEYPFVELLTGVLFLLVAWHLFNSEMTIDILMQLPFVLAVTALLIGISVYDFHYYLIPNVFVYGIAAIAVVYHFILVPAGILPPSFARTIPSALLGALIGGGFFFLLTAISRGRWMGLGDGKLGGAAGLFLGFPLALVALIFAFISGGLFASLLVILGKKGMKSHVPFGPFIALGALAAILWGGNIIHLYLNLFMISPIL